MDIIITFLIYFLLLIISYIITQLMLQKIQNLPPSPFPTIPILGHLHLLKNPTKIHRTLATLSEKYGPVIRLEFGLRQTILVSSISAAEDCLHTNDTTFANRPNVVASHIVGYGRTNILWAPYGPLWRAHRKVAATEILSPHRVNTLSHIRAEEVMYLIQLLYIAYEGEVIEIKPGLMGLTTNVMLRMIAGKRLYGTEEESKEAIRFDGIMKDMQLKAFCAVDFFPFLKYFGMKKAAENKFWKLFTPMDEFFQELLDEQKTKMEEHRSTGNIDGDIDKDKKNLIWDLLELKQRDPEYSTDDIIKGLGEVLIFAGTETSASTMEWALALLLNNPETLERAKQEIDNYVGNDRFIEEHDLAHLPYLHCIINETLRMYPPGPLLLPHECSSDCVVGGYHIPKGTMLNLNIWTIQNDPSIWNEPTKFKPERFEGVKGNRIGYQFMPFGSGKRACPGENLAMRVVGLTLGSLIQCFDMKSIGEINMDEKVAFSMWKAKPLHAKFSPHPNMVDLLARVFI